MSAVMGFDMARGDDQSVLAFWRDSLLTGFQLHMLAYNPVDCRVHFARLFDGWIVWRMISSDQFQILRDGVSDDGLIICRLQSDYCSDCPHVIGGYCDAKNACWRREHGELRARSVAAAGVDICTASIL